MSWEEMGTRSVPCPCGMGTISQTSYGDDWNQIEYGPVVINCDDCKERYRVEEEHHMCPYPGHGGHTNYYLTPINYPTYSGTELSKVYSKHNSGKSYFANYLVESYTFEELREAKNEATNKTASSKLSGSAGCICYDCKRVLKTSKLKVIREQIEEALKKYPNYDGTKEQRNIIQEKEEHERRIYNKEKRKYQILIDL